MMRRDKASAVLVKLWKYDYAQSHSILWYLTIFVRAQDKSSDYAPEQQHANFSIFFCKTDSLTNKHKVINRNYNKINNK